MCGLAIGLAAGPGFVFGFIGLALQDELGISHAALGLLIGLFFGSTAVASLLAARWGASLGARRCLVSNMIVVAAAGLVAALRGTYLVLAIVAVAAGAAYAFGNVGTNLAVMAAARPGATGLALTVKTAGVPVVASLLAVGGGSAETTGWRAVALGLAVAGGLTAVAVALLLPRAGESTVIARPEPLLRPGFWVLPAAAFLFICGTQPLQSWLVTYLHDEAGLPLTHAGTLMAMGTLLALAVMLAAARLARGRRRPGPNPWAGRQGSR